MPRFITKKWIEVHDQSGTAKNIYNPNKQTRFKYTSNIIGKAPNNNNDNNNVIENVEIVVPLKPLSNFWRTLDMPLISCEVSLTLTWSTNYVLTDIITRAAVPAQGENPERPAINGPTGAIFKIEDTKLYVSVVTLSAEN